MIGIWFPITKGKHALVDRELYIEATQYKWTYHHSGHVCRKIKVGPNKFSTLSLHQFVIFKHMDSYTGDIDHKNRDKLDCRFENLRIGTRSQNQANVEKVKGGTSKYKGVCIQDGYITAHIMVNRKQIHLGTFTSERDAALAYNTAAIKYFGNFACLNDVGVR